MLQISVIENCLDDIVERLSKRKIKNVKDQLLSILHLNDKRKSTQQELDVLLQKSNQLASQIGQLYKEGRHKEADDIKEQTSTLKERSRELGEALDQFKMELTNALYHIPNVPHASVPAGQTAEDNEVIMTSTDRLPELSAHAKPHWDLIQAYDLIDFELGNKITGSGFPVYKNQGAKLVRGLINYFLDEATKAGFSEVQPPILINEASGCGTGQLPDKEGQMYHISDTDLYLIPTAEVPITNLYRDTIQAEDDLPIRNCAYTPCFRREAGSWGSHVRGLNRLHQFDKVEIVQVVKPENSYQVLDEMVAYVESLVKALELPYRMLKLCGRDLGFTAALTYDFEVYSAGQKKWLEVSSVSNFETYQANRLKLRYKNTEGKKQLVHTLNGSALALPRIVAALLENNQRTSEIKMPEVLKNYLGFEVIEKQ